MAIIKHSPFDSFYSSSVYYNLKIVTQPSLVRTSGKEKRSIIPSPVLQLQIIDINTNADITEHCIAFFFIKACIYKEPEAQDSGEMVDLRFDECESNKNLIGTSVVSGDFIKNRDRKFLLFNFNSLGLRVKGHYRIRFTVFEYCGFGRSSGMVKPIKSVVSSLFSCYSSREFYSYKISCQRDEILSRITEISGNQINSENDLLTEVPKNIVIKRSRHNTITLPDINVTVAPGEAPIKSRKRASFSFLDKDSLALNQNEANCYYSDNNYPGTPKRHRSPLISSFTNADEQGQNEDQKNKITSSPLLGMIVSYSNPFDESSNDSSNNGSSPNVNRLFSKPASKLAENEFRSLSGNDTMLYANSRPEMVPVDNAHARNAGSLPNIVIESDKEGSNTFTGRLDGIWEKNSIRSSSISDSEFSDDEDENQIRKLTQDINATLSRSPSPMFNFNASNHSANIHEEVDPLTSIGMDQAAQDNLDYELTKVLSNSSNHMFDLGHSIQNSPSIHENLDLDRVLSNNSNTTSIQNTDLFGLERILSNNSVSNQNPDPYSESQFMELQYELIMERNATDFVDDLQQMPDPAQNSHPTTSLFSSLISNMFDNIQNNKNNNDQFNFPQIPISETRVDANSRRSNHGLTDSSTMSENDFSHHTGFSSGISSEISDEFFGLSPLMDARNTAGKLRIMGSYNK